MRRTVAIWLAIGGIAVLAGGVGYASLIEELREIPDVELATVDRGTIVRTIAATGRSTPLGWFRLDRPVSGRILSLNADFNSVVHQDQVVAQIAPEGFAARVAEATAQRDVAASGIAAAKAQLARARADAENERATRQVLGAKVRSAQSVTDQAKRELQRASASGRADYVAVAERERVNSAFDQAQAALAATTAEETPRRP